MALLATVAVLSMAVAPSALAAPTYNWVNDQDGINDEPGQKDLTAQASGFDGTQFYTAWQWDELSWSGNNTGDACALFDVDATGTAGDGLVDYAVCVTVGTSSGTELNTRVYSCGDTRADRCTSPTLIANETTTTWCTVTDQTSAFGGNNAPLDTRAECNISQIDSDLTAVTGLNNGTLLNSCSYPSQEPNSDPSDCVIIIANQDVTVSTDSRNVAATTWTATLHDTASLTPSSATGSVTFKLYSDSLCQNLVWQSVADTTAPYSTVGLGTASGSNQITNTSNHDSDLTYYWIADYTPSGLFNGDSSTCGEPTTIAPPSVTGSTGS